MRRKKGRPIKTKAGLDMMAFVKSLKQKFGEQTVDLLEDSTLPSLTPHRIGTGALNLDWALSGGIPTSRIIEIFSQTGSEGKTTLAVSILNTAQANGALTMFLDTERSAEKSRMKELGVNQINKNFFYGQPETMERAFEIVDEFFTDARKRGHKGEMVVVIDTIAATETEDQSEGDYDKQGFAQLARVMSSGLRKINKVVAQTGGTLIFINQSREKVGVVYGKKTDTPGGKALKFYAACRIELHKHEIVYGPNKTPLGITVKAKVEKNKAGAPFRTALIDFMFTSGINALVSSFRFALQEGVIVKDGPMYREAGSKVKFFSTKFEKYLDEHPEMEKKIAKAFVESMKANVHVVSPIVVEDDDDEEGMTTVLQQARRE